MQPPRASWGTILQQGYIYIYYAFYYAVFPALAIVLVMLLLNVLARSLQVVVGTRVRGDRRCPAARRAAARSPSIVSGSSFAREDASTELVHDVSFALRRGERLALVGESGSGKTITALALMRLLRDPLVLAGGSISLGGDTELTTMSERELARIRGGRVAMIYQDPLTALNPVLRIGHQLVEAIRLHSPLSKAAARKRAIELLGQVGLSQPASRIDAYPHEFSGGMRQRVMIAMALSGDPEVLIADEPTTALDVTTQARILALLDDLVSERGISVLLITHDLGIAAGFCDRVHVMYAGRIVERSDVFSIYPNPLHPYSEALLDAVCRLDIDLSHEIPAIPGYPPAPTALPRGLCVQPPLPLAPARLPHRGARRRDRRRPDGGVPLRGASGSARRTACPTSEVACRDELGRAAPGHRDSEALQRRARRRRPRRRRGLVRRRPG